MRTEIPSTPTDPMLDEVIALPDTLSSLLDTAIAMMESARRNIQDSTDRYRLRKTRNRQESNHAELERIGQELLSGVLRSRTDPDRQVGAGPNQDESAAITRMVDFERRSSYGEYDPWRDRSKKLTLEGVIDQFINSRKHCVPKTRKHYRSVLNLLSEWVGPTLPY